MPSYNIPFTTGSQVIHRLSPVLAYFNIDIYISCYKIKSKKLQMDIGTNNNLKTRDGLKAEIKECLETAKTIYSEQGLISPVCFMLREHETAKGKHIDRVLFPLSYEGFLSTLQDKDMTDGDRDTAKKLFEVIGVNLADYKDSKPSDWLYIAGRMANLTKLDIQGVMMIAEAWTSKIPKLETQEEARKITISPSADPNRKEAIVCEILNTEGVGEVDGLEITKAGKGGEFAPLFPKGSTNSLQNFYRGYWGLK